MRRVLVAVNGDDVSARFDLTAEVVVAELADGSGGGGRPRTILLARPSAEELSALILKEGVTEVVCGAIEESHYKYLGWKNIRVIDSVIGPYREALEKVAAKTLSSRSILSGARRKGGLA